MVFLLLSVAPPRAAIEPLPVERSGGPSGSAWAAAAQGVIASTALTLLFVATGALIFGVYGFGMFVASPFVIGMLLMILILSIWPQIALWLPQVSAG